MFLVDIGSSALTLNNPITLASTPKISTNNNVSLNSTNNGIVINSPGWYKVKLQAVITASGTTSGAVLVTNGDVVADSEVTITTESPNVYEVYIEYPVQVIANNSNSKATVQFNATANATSASGYVTVERIQ